MTQKMIDEIAVALNQGLYLVALSAALTLPDVCGKAEYPEERVSTRYKKWYSTFVPDGNLPEDSVYALRCSLLHEGNTNAKDKNDIKFQLMTNVLSKMRLAIADAIQKASYGGDRISAKNAAQRIVADIVTQIGELQKSSEEEPV